MSDIFASPAMNACMSCKHGKRKCDRNRPSCSTCARFDRACIYEEDSQLSPRIGRQSPQAYPTESDGGASSSAALGTSQGSSPGLGFANAVHGFDPFRYDSLRLPTVDVTVTREALKIFGTLNELQATSSAYFNSIYHRLPIISSRSFSERLPTIFAGARADFAALCLCIHLVQQNPVLDGQSMQSSLYITIKSIISLLEGTGYLSLEVVQCRLLLTFYEMGHGIFPAASISIGACARMSRALGLHKHSLETEGSESGTVVAEEQKRVWWAVINLDRVNYTSCGINTYLRFINLCTRDPLFATEDPKSTDYLPIEDAAWAQDLVPVASSATLATPSDITVGQFARECQVSHLVGRVVRHVFDPASDPAFQAEEALQLERTLMAFMPLLMEEELQFGRYCAALGMCSSALFALYDLYMRQHEGIDAETRRILQSMEPLSSRIVEFSSRLFGVEEDIRFGTLSPYVPYSLYQAAVVQFRMWKQSNEAYYKDGLDSLKKILGYFHRRWLIAGRYLNALEAEWPPIMLPPEY